MQHYTFDTKSFPMADIIDICEGWNDDTPPLWSIVVYSQAAGKQFFTRTLENLSMMYVWKQADLKLKIARRQKAEAIQAQDEVEQGLKHVMSQGG